jgi:hypothetical protein
MIQVLDFTFSASPLGWTLIIFFAIFYFIWRIYRGGENKRFRESVATFNDVQDAKDKLVSALPKAVNDDLRKQVATLLEQRAKLEQERGWILVMVQIRGMKDPNWPERIPHASVLWNPATGKYKPPEEGYRRFSGKLERLLEIIGPAAASEFGAPPYQKLDDNRFLMCGVVYTGPN